MTEPRLIDADALMETIYEHDYELRTRTGSTDYGMFSSGIYQAIDEQPTIDPESLRPQGRWLKTQEPLGWEEVDCAECSECHESWVVDMDYDYDFLEFWHYCPNCGAKMDEEEEK